MVFLLLDRGADPDAVIKVPEKIRDKERLREADSDNLNINNELNQGVEIKNLGETAAYLAVSELSEDVAIEVCC